MTDRPTRPTKRPKRRRKPGRPASAVSKAMLTLAAMVGTLAGWAYLSMQGAAEAAPEPSPTVMVLEFDPIPTVMPAQTLMAQADSIEPAPAATAPVLRRVDVPVASGGSSRPRASASSRSSG